jgi:hypothetical protein
MNITFEEILTNVWRGILRRGDKVTSIVECEMAINATKDEQAEFFGYLTECLIRGEM